MAKRKTKQTLKYSETLALLYGDGPWTIRGVKRVDMKPIRVADGPSGLRKSDDNTLELGKCAESIAYPCPALVASSFDVDLMQEYGKMLGRECRANGVNALLGPGINIKRNPLCGRNFEYFSEDPYLSGMLAAGFTKGIQSVGVAACLKHFACNSQESYRLVNDSVVDIRALHEIYLRAFQIAIKESKPWMVMAAYNKINGVYACENKYLLSDTLKGKWKYDGVVVSDWGGINDPVLCHSNGLDVEMPGMTNRYTRLANASRGHRNFIHAARDSAERILKLSQRTHDERLKVGAFNFDDGHRLAVKMAEKSIVLVKNNGILPLKSMQNIAIIGELAGKPRLGGGGSSQVGGHEVVSFVDYCKKQLGEENVSYAPGYSIDAPEPSPDLPIDALDLASKYDTVIYFMGTSAKEESEGYDREDLRINDYQLELFHRLVEINHNVIVVLCTGAPVDTSFIENTAATFFAYFSGEGGGEALYNLILGISNPCGHLTESWPARNYQVPSFGFYPGGQSMSLYRESIYVGYRYYVTVNEEPRFPFGFGLSYTEFSFNKMSVSAKRFMPTDTVTVTVNVSNKKKIAGDVLVQLYIAPPEDRAVYKAKRTLQGFKKVHLEGGEKADVTIEIDRRAFEHFDTESGDFEIERGHYLIEVGTSCKDILLSAPIDVEGTKEFKTQIDKLSIYYNVPKDGFWQYDDIFEKLLGRIVPIPRDPRARPYTLNSTFENIGDTYIGKRLASIADKKFENDPNPAASKKMFLQMPIRSIILAGMKEKFAHVIVDLANRQFGKALFHLLITRQ